ncbi:MAG TPA: hypothetical protein VFN55_19120 [Solirubrobacteraceae bacterium]|nr:hypothetical protein [Solirubrobacteraceae bacterium]
MPRTAGGEHGLLCPGCGARQPEAERFCPACALPLIRSEGLGPPPVLSERQRWARQIKPQLAEGRLVRVAGAANLAEAEFIQALLLEEGVPSLLRRSAGYDVPDLLAAGPRDVIVPASGAAVAREVLLEADLIASGPPAPGYRAEPRRLLAGLVLALAGGLVLLWLLGSVLHV